MINQPRKPRQDKSNLNLIWIHRLSMSFLYLTPCWYSEDLPAGSICVKISMLPWAGQSRFTVHDLPNWINQSWPRDESEWWSGSWDVTCVCVCVDVDLTSCVCVCVSASHFVYVCVYLLSYACMYVECFLACVLKHDSSLVGLHCTCRMYISVCVRACVLYHLHVCAGLPLSDYRWYASHAERTSVLRQGGYCGRLDWWGLRVVYVCEWVGWTWSFYRESALLRPSPYDWCLM